MEVLNMSSEKRAWLIRPRPHGIYRMNEFKAQNIVAIGWPGIGDLTGQSREELKHRLSLPPYDLSGLALGNAYATIDIVVNQMQPGDLVLAADGDDIYLGRISGGYRFDPSVDNDAGGYPHQRPVEWFPVNLSRNALSRDLRCALRVHRTAANLSHHYAEIEALSRGEQYQPLEDPGQTVEVSYPLRPDFVIQFEIPNDITRNEAQRLSSYFASLYFTE